MNFRIKAFKKNHLKYPQTCQSSRTSDTSDDTFFLSNTRSTIRRVKKNPFHVKFSSIEVRHYDITLGDNPSCTQGPPVALDWRYDEMEPISIDSYEEERGHKEMYQMHMQSRQRHNLLKISAGITDAEMIAVMDEIVKVQKKRKRTKRRLLIWKLQDAAGAALRKLQGCRSGSHPCA